MDDTSIIGGSGRNRTFVLGLKVPRIAIVLQTLVGSKGIEPLASVPKTVVLSIKLTPRMVDGEGLEPSYSA